MSTPARWGEIAAVVMDRYDNLPRLNGLRSRAEGIRRLLNHNGFADVRVDLADDGAARSVIDAFRSWRPNCRRLVLYWGGHGKELDGGGFFLCCRDTVRHREPDPHTAMPAAELGRLLAELGVAETVLLMDACGAGGGAAEVVNAFTAKVSRTAHAGPRPSLSVISSASHRQQARENTFAAAVASVLRDGAPVNSHFLLWTDRDSHITPVELVQGVGVLLERDTGGIQTPDHSMTGTIGRFFPNPRFRANVPDTDLEDGRLAVHGRQLLPQDVTDHFMLKFRGIDSAEDRGWYFTGRHQVLRRIVEWLGSGTGMLVVTGGPGCGKSALLGRLAVLSVAGYRDEVRRQGGMDQLPPDTVPPVGALDAGVHAKNKSLLDCVAELGAALDIAPPPAGWRSPAELLLRLAARHAPTTLLFDALDEAQPAELPALTTDLLRPLAELPGVRVLIGTRPAGAATHDAPRDGGSLLAALGVADEHAIWLDRDVDRLADITEYARRRLVSIPGSAYRDRPADADTAAARIAAHSDGVFLFARLLAGMLARRGDMLDLTGPEAESLFSGGISEAFAADLRRFGADEPKVRALLGPLAFAEGAGLPGRDIWLAVANATRHGFRYPSDRFTEADLAWVTARAGTHIVTSTEDDQTVYRLYHQSYNDFFHAELDADHQDPVAVQAMIVHFLLQLVPTSDGVREWSSANPYLLKHLAAHAARSDRLALLCDDPGFLIHADPVRLQRVLRTVDYQDSPLVRLYWRALSELPGTTPEERSDILGAVALREESEAIGLLPKLPDAVWCPLWSVVAPSAVNRPLGSHRMPALTVEFGLIGRRPVLVSGGGDHTVRLWDPETGEARGTFVGHRAAVLAAVVGTVHGRGTIVSGDGAGVLRVWDVATGQCTGTMTTRRGAVLSLAILSTSDSDALVCAGEDGSVIRVWRLSDLTLIAELPDHHTAIRGLAVLANPDAPTMLLSGGDDGQVALWDAATWRLIKLIDTTGYPLAIAAGRVRGRLTLATGGLWGTVSLWSLPDGTFLRSLRGHLSGLNSMAFGSVYDKTVLATASGDGGVWLWDPATGVRLEAVRSAPPIRFTFLEKTKLERRRLLGPAGGAIATEEDRNPAGRPAIRRHESNSMLAVRLAEIDRRAALVTGGIDGAVRLWDVGAPGVVDNVLTALTSVCTGTIEGRPVVVTGHRFGPITIRDAQTGSERHRLSHPGGPVHCVLTGWILGQNYVIGGGEDGTLRFWHAETGEPNDDLTMTNPHRAPVLGACFFRTGAGEHLAHLAGNAIVVTHTGTLDRSVIDTGRIVPVNLSVVPGRDADQLVTGDLNGNVRVFGLDGGQLVERWHGQGLPLPLGAAVADKEVNVLAIAGQQHRISIWPYQEPNGDMLKEKPTLGFEHNAPITALAYSDVLGGVLAAGGADGSLTLSDAVTAEHILDLPGHLAAVRAVAFATTATGTILVSCGDEGVQAISLREHRRDVQ